MIEFGKLIAPYARRIANMLARGSVKLADSSKKMQTLQISLLAGELKDGIEHFEPFGFTSCPLPGAEPIAGFLGGDRAHGIVLVVADRRYRVVGLQGGEAALHDAFGNKVHLHNDGRIEVVASLKVQITSPLVTMSGNLQVTGDVTVQGKTDVTGNITSAANMVATGSVSAASMAASGNISASGGALSMTGMKATYNSHTHVENALPGSTNTPTQTM